MILRSESGYVLHERASDFFASGTGWLSVKSFAGGQALYTAGGGTFAVDPASYLVLNHGTPYTIAIESNNIVESCCIFWTPAAVASAYHALSTPDAGLLVDSAPRSPAPTFVERTYPAGDELSRLAGRLCALSNTLSPEPAWIEEQLHLMLAALLRSHASVEREIAALPRARAATRTELYRRLHLARDFAEASLDRPVRLAELAAVAGMSSNHLLRGFQQLFGCTPLQYLSKRRIELACRLLVDSDLSVAEVCLAVGYQSFSSFSHSFSRYTGFSPSQYRSAKRSAN